MIFVSLPSQKGFPLEHEEFMFLQRQHEVFPFSDEQRGIPQIHFTTNNINKNQFASKFESIRNAMILFYLGSFVLRRRSLPRERQTEALHR